VPKDPETMHVLAGPANDLGEEGRGDRLQPRSKQRGGKKEGEPDLTNQQPAPKPNHRQTGRGEGEGEGRRDLEPCLLGPNSLRPQRTQSFTCKQCQEKSDKFAAQVSKTIPQTRTLHRPAERPTATTVAGTRWRPFLAKKEEK
jgi:hypothetical protein